MIIPLRRAQLWLLLPTLVGTCFAWAAATQRGHFGEVRGVSQSEGSYRYRASWTMPAVQPFAPLDVALGNDDRLYIADGLSNVVQIFDTDGERVGTLTKPPSTVVAHVPRAVDATTTDGVVYVAWGDYLPDYESGAPGRHFIVGGDTSVPQPGRAITDLEYTGASRFSLAGYGFSGLVSVWSSPPGMEVVLEDDRQGIPRIGVWPDGVVSLVLGNDGVVENYDAAGGRRDAWRLDGLTALSPVVNEREELDVLVRPAAQSPSELPHVVTLDRGGRRLQDLHFDDSPHRYRAPAGYVVQLGRTTPPLGDGTVAVPVVGL